MAASRVVTSSVATAASLSIAAESKALHARNLSARSLCNELSFSFHAVSLSLRLQVSTAISANVCGDGFVVSGRASRAAIVVNKSLITSAKTLRKKSQYEVETFTGWLLRGEQEGEITKELTIVLSSIAVACKQIAALVKRAAITNLTGVQGRVNVQGEDQKKLDAISNKVFSSCLRLSGRTGIIASEEEDSPVAVEESYSGNYVVLFDPLDGSSSIDAAVSSGSIFGIYNPTEECLADLDDEDNLGKVQENCIVNVCQPGRNLLAAGYCMYSSSVILVLSVGNGVYGFTLDPLVKEFVLTHRDIKIPQNGNIYSFNEGKYELWDPKLKKYIDSLKVPDASGKPYSARYLGSLVGDFHRIMLYGGIYGYPADKKNVAGKLRLLYECAPMSFLAEQASGKGSDGSDRILDIQPDEVHQRVPLYVGSHAEVEKLEQYLA